jgi:putative aldouronate transport system substrate-binding protein
MTGKVGMYSEDAGNSYGKDANLDVLQKTVQGAKLTPIDPFTNVQGKHAKPSYIPAGMMIMVPKSSKHAVEAVKYLDWMSKKENMWMMAFGVEGKNYKVENGIPTAIASDDSKNLLFNTGDMLIVSNGIDFGDADKNVSALVTWAPENQRKDLATAYKNGLTDGIPQIRLPRPMQSEVKYTKTLHDKYQELLVKSIIAKPADFDKTYDAALADYMANGGADVAKERKEMYPQMKK